MASKKQKRKFKARRFVKHLARFVDSHRYPNFQISEEIIVAESKRQTYGEKSLTKDEVLLIEPLRDAQRWKEVTIDGLVSEMSEWWSKGWGWYYPMYDEVKRIQNDWIMKKALLEIKRRCDKDFMEYLIDRGGYENYIALKANLL
jgi:hypothetical protein